MNVGEPGSIPIPEWIEIRPWPLGSGKLVTPCLRMHAENFAPATVPTLIAIWNWPLGAPPGAPSRVPVDLEPLFVVVVVVVVPDEPMLATLGEPGPPPQPAPSSVNAANATAVASVIRRRIASAPFSCDRWTA